MPAGPARSEARVPGRLAGAPRAPDQDVKRVLLARPARIAAAAGGDVGHLRQVVSARRAGSGQRAEHRIRRPGEVGVLVHAVQGAAVGHLGVEALDDRQRLDRTDQVGGRQDAQRLHVGAVPLGLAGGQLAPILAIAGRALKQRVVDVGYVLHVADGEPRLAGAGLAGGLRGLRCGVQPGADEEVPGGVGGGVADVRRVVRGDAAGVQHGHRARRGQDELAGDRVVQPGRRPAARKQGDICAAPRLHVRQVIAGSEARWPAD